MRQNQRFNNLSGIESRFKFYSVIRSYYLGNLWHDAAKWSEAVQILSEIEDNKQSQDYCSGLSLIKAHDSDAIYEFNKLFVGPDRLLAPPYESVYRNPQRLLMQQETLEVREFYHKMGLAVDRQNSEPDDYIGFELEFICYLLYKSAESLEIEDFEDVNIHLNAYEDFYINHLSKWLPEHCRDILANSQNDICRGMAIMINGFMDLESKLMAKRQM